MPNGVHIIKTLSEAVKITYIIFPDDPCYQLLWDVNDPENKRQTVEVYQNGSKALSLFGIILHFSHNRFLCVKTVTKRRFNVPNGILFPLVCELPVWY